MNEKQLETLDNFIQKSTQVQKKLRDKTSAEVIMQGCFIFLLFQERNYFLNEPFVSKWNVLVVHLI